MELVIAEKPSVARDLAHVLGVRAAKGAEWLENDRYAITWCIGHLVELDEPASYDPAWKPWRLDRLPMLPADFKLRPAAHATKQLRVVAKLLKDKRFSRVINACDAGREGELIFRYVYQHARSRLPVHRLWISSLTDEAIRRGFGALRPGADFDRLADAARSRSEADWLVGLNATRAITVRSRDGGSGDALFSIGRVQTPTLALLVTREQEIRSFTPTPYWEIRGDFRTTDGATFPTLWRSGKVSRLAAVPLANDIVARDRDHAASDAHVGERAVGPRVVNLRSRTVKEAPPQLFDLTSLQRTANRRFGFSAARTLEIAQALYERHKIVTYPRTDSRHLSTDVAKELPNLFRSLTELPEYAPFARQLVEHPPRPTGRIVDDAKVHDHHAIIPTGARPRGMLDRDESRLFDLIVRRFLGAFFPDAELAITEAWIRVGPDSGMPPPDFAAADRDKMLDALPPPPDHYLARGRVRTVAGWQEVAGIDAMAAAKAAARHDAPTGKDGGGSAGSSGSGAAHSRDGDRDDDLAATALPPLVMGQRLDGAFTPIARETKPPPRYTEGTLLAAMESAGKSIDDEALRAAMKDVGLGTPATRAAIIETLLRRRYVVRDRQQLVPTDAGIGLIGVLAATKVSSLASAELTGSWEARLARIARGEDTRASFMADIGRYVTNVIDAIRGGPAPAMPAASVPSAPSSPCSSSPPSSSTPASRSPASAGDSRGASSWKRGRGGKGGGGQRSGTGGRRTPSDRGAQPPATRPSSAPRGAAPAPGRAAPPARSRLDDRGTASPPVHSRLDDRGAPRPAKTTSARRQNTKLGGAPLTCPRCRTGQLITGSRGWGCDRWRDGCRFVVWFETAGRRLTPAQLRALVTQGKTRTATFLDANGHEIAARLILDPALDGGARIEPG